MGSTVQGQRLCLGLLRLYPQSNQGGLLGGGSVSMKTYMARERGSCEKMLKVGKAKQGNTLMTAEIDFVSWGWV